MGLWIPCSAELLLKAEEAVLRCVNSAYSLRDVCVNLTTKSVGLFRTRETTESYSIRTISFENESSHNNNQLPLVMIHGFASGLGLWVLNYDSLAPKVPLHALDLLGFASSSRNYPFSKDSQECIDSYVDSVEKWRQSLKLEKFVLLGHSFGAYLSYFYLLKYPQRVQHLILADPWGMSHRTEEEASRFKIPLYIRPVVSVVTKFNPLAALRAGGPLGASLIPRLRGDILKRFEALYTDNTVADYIYHCNVQNPSGESAFYNICQPLGWPRIGMIMKEDEVPDSARITVLYGEKSWMNSETGYRMQENLNKRGIFFDVRILLRCTHHIYADDPENFNKIILEVMEKENQRSAELSTSDVVSTSTADEEIALKIH